MIHTSEQCDVAAYLNRIGYEGPLEPTLEVLKELQRLHVHAVPYENLDILAGIPLSLSVPELYHKIVTARRGGYCFELNALFGWLLEQAGYEVTNYFGRFWKDEPVTPAKRRHHILHVVIDGKRYITDVGVGGAGPREPLELIEDAPQTQGDECYQLSKSAAYGWMLYEQKGEGWNPVFSFTEEPNLPEDFLTTSYWCEHAPDSPFNKTARVSIRTAEGRNTIDDREFSIYTKQGVHVFRPASKQEYTEALARYFGIRLTGELPWLE